MSIDSFVDTRGITINIENQDEIYHSLDIIHTQFMDNEIIDNKAPALLILEKTMNELVESYPEIDTDGY